METAKHRAEGLALALTISGIAPCAILAVVFSCKPLLDALPWLYAAALAAGCAKLWRWAAC